MVGQKDWWYFCLVLNGWLLKVWDNFLTHHWGHKGKFRPWGTSVSWQWLFSNVSPEWEDWVDICIGWAMPQMLDAPKKPWPWPWFKGNVPCPLPLSPGYGCAWVLWECDFSAANWSSWAATRSAHVLLSIDLSAITLSEESDSKFVAVVDLDMWEGSGSGFWEGVDLSAITSNPLVVARSVFRNPASWLLSFKAVFSDNGGLPFFTILVLRLLLPWVFYLFS